MRAGPLTWMWYLSIIAICFQKSCVFGQSLLKLLTFRHCRDINDSSLEPWNGWPRLHLAGASAGNASPQLAHRGLRHPASEKPRWRMACQIPKS